MSVVVVLVVLVVVVLVSVPGLVLWAVVVAMVVLNVEDYVTPSVRIFVLVSNSPFYGVEMRCRWFISSIIELYEYINDVAACFVVLVVVVFE